MRLLNTRTLQVKEFLESGSTSTLVHIEGSNVSSDGFPKYAILSHTWGDGEVSFQDMQGDRELAERKDGFAKLRASCALALKEGYGYIWIDTCCIDKTSSAELSEAINSMYRWYKNSAVCYAHLADVEGDDPLKISKQNANSSRWYRRGWTLQELIAPKNLRFYNGVWKFIGTKIEHKLGISNITGIDLYALDGGDMRMLTIARRMSWVANRQTTRSEDMAYCLLGVFDINMPLLYGEGDKAFVRLQEEIMKVSDDQSIFAWRDDHSMGLYDRRGLLTSSPTHFRTSGDVAQFHSERPGRSVTVSTNQGLRLDLLMCQDTSYQSGLLYVAVIDCQLGSIPGVLAGIRLRRLSPDGEQYARVNADQLFKFGIFDEEGEIDLQGFAPTKKQDKLVDLKLRESPTLLETFQDSDN